MRKVLQFRFRGSAGRQLLAASLALGLAAAGATAAIASRSPESRTADNQRLEYGFANLADFGLFGTLRKGVEKAAKTVGADLKYYNNNLDGATTVRNARLMVQEKVDFIFEYNPVVGLDASVGGRFKRAGIPCIAINSLSPPCPWFNQVNKSIGVDTAKIVGPIAKAKGWTGENTTVLLVQFAPAGTEVNDAVRWFYVALQNIVPGLSKTTPGKIGPSTTTIGTTGVQVSAVTLDQAFTAVRNVLQTIPKDRNLIVFAINDDDALGAWRAIEQDGRGPQTLIAGLGGDPPSLRQLRTNPQWVAEADTFFYYWGEYLFAMSRAILNGVKPPARTLAPQVVLTKKTIGQYYKPGKTRAFRLPPLRPVKNGIGNAYLAKTGVLQKFNNVTGLK